MRLVTACSEAEAAADRIAELEKESAARQEGWDRDAEAWATERASLLEDLERRVEKEAREGASRMQAVTDELTAEYERLSDEHVALEREAKELRAVSIMSGRGARFSTVVVCAHRLVASGLQAAHKAEYDKLRAETVLAEVQENMKQELPGLDLQMALRERTEVRIYGSFRGLGQHSQFSGLAASIIFTLKPLSIGSDPQKRTKKAQSSTIPLICVGFVRWVVNMGRLWWPRIAWRRRWKHYAWYATCAGNLYHDQSEYLRSLLLQVIREPYV